MSESAVMVGGRYRLLRTIGKGGMGTVWHAHDEVLGRDVAVKEVPPPPELTGAEREDFAVRTFREARAAGRVAHPGVATVYDVLEERGHPWIVMQLVRSRTLGELLRDEGPMTPLRAADIGLQLLEALRAAHAAGVLHRDVKPDNVLLTEDGRAVLTDFGIATTEDEAPVTRTGVLVGTPAFVAPERAAGGRARPASDLWSLGVTLYLAVEGHSPFHRDNALATLGAVMHAEPAPLARAGVLAPVLHGLLRKDPAERMTLEETERRLAGILAGGSPEQTGPVPLPARTGPVVVPRRRSLVLPAAAIAGGALLVGIVTGGAAWWSKQGREQPRGGRPVPAVATTSAPADRDTTTKPPPAGESPRSDTEVVTPRSDTQVVTPRSTPPPARTEPRTPDTGERTQKRRPRPDDTPTRTRDETARKNKTAQEDETDRPQRQSESPSEETPGQIEGSDGG
ncbi:protein kinase [Nonomuraea sp. NPDC049419]|uniref:serine/threonine-protein kinase n=1 Tax=Nonomuraea sp. NPDC049419 TaxID=3155772 RepID=UPI003437FF55